MTIAMMVMTIVAPSSPKLQTTQSNTISKMMDPIVQVQQYTFSYRKALFSPQSGLVVKMLIIRVLKKRLRATF